MRPDRDVDARFLPSNGWSCAAVHSGSFTIGVETDFPFSRPTTRMISIACLGSASSSSASPFDLTCLFRKVAFLSSPGPKTKRRSHFDLVSLFHDGIKLVQTFLVYKLAHTISVTYNGEIQFTVHVDARANYGLLQISFNQARSELHLLSGTCNAGPYIAFREMPITVEGPTPSGINYEGTSMYKCSRATNVLK